MKLDLILLAADNNIKETVIGILGREKSLGIRPITCQAIVHPNRDPGCYQTGAEMLWQYARTTEHALVVFDLAWHGAPRSDPVALAQDVEEKLTPVWGNRARCVVIAPEVEAWAWSESPYVADAMGWGTHWRKTREWLKQEGLWKEGAAKPEDPKAAFEAALRKVRLAPSAAIFRRIADRASLRGCQDQSFLRLLEILRSWFG